MFDTPLSVIFMECGHPIHKSCFDQYMTTSYKCPLCNKSIVKMDALFLNLANIIKEQPMPEAWQHMRSVVLCNDCSAKCSTQYHFLGLRCQNCQSYNTVELHRSPMPAFDEQSDPGSEQATVQAQDTALRLAHPQTPVQPDDGNQIYSDGEDEDGDTDLWGRDHHHESSEEDGDDGESEDEEEEEDDEEEEESESDDDEHDGDIVLLGHR